MQPDVVTFPRKEFEAFVNRIHRDLEVSLQHFADHNPGTGVSWVKAAIAKLPPIVEPYGYIEYRGWPPEEEPRYSFGCGSASRAA